MKFSVFGDNRIEAGWFVNLSPLLRSAAYKKIAARGSNPAAIDDLVRYDRPDIILEAHGRPVLVVEKTREVPTGHNVGQRIARLVRAVEQHVPTIAFFPFDARKHGDHTSICNLNIRLLVAFERMRAIHNTPILAINWPVDEHGELLHDGSENDVIRHVVHEYLSSGCDPACIAMNEQLASMKREHSVRLRRYPRYASPPGDSVRFEKTEEVLTQFNGGIPRADREVLRGRPQSLIYQIVMSPEKCRREDPYTGTQFIYDYLWCRSGPSVADKHTNLILHFPRISRARWYAANPNDPSRKSCNWYLTASALWFKDGLDVLR